MLYMVWEVQMEPMWRWVGVAVVCMALGIGCGGQKAEPPIIVQEPTKETKEEVNKLQTSEVSSSDADAKKVIGSLTFVRIEPGSFRMGSPVDGPDKDVRDDDEHQHTVTISKGFWIASHEVTQELYYAVVKANPSYFTEKKYCPDHRIVYKDNSGEDIPVCKNLPVENVSWNDAQEFIAALNRIDNKGYRLPTEAEWEYAVRGGHKIKMEKKYSVYSFGGDANALADHAWYEKNSDEHTHPVGKKPPLKIGEGTLYDMHGNVWEWVQDWYGDYPKDAAVDPQGPSEGRSRVIRGGGWIDYARNCRSANRYYGDAVGRFFIIGFRLVRMQ